MDSVPPAADARQDAPAAFGRWLPEPAVKDLPELCVIRENDEETGDAVDYRNAVRLCTRHNEAIDEIERLQGVNESHSAYIELMESDEKATKAEIERLQGELAAYVKRYGPLCECGHPQAGHSSHRDDAGVVQWGGCLDFCQCTAFTPRQAPAEGKGEGG